MFSKLSLSGNASSAGVIWGGAFRDSPLIGYHRLSKQAVGIPLRQLAYSMMDLSLSLGAQSNLSKEHQERYGLRPEAPAELYRPLGTIHGKKRGQP